MALFDDRLRNLLALARDKSPSNRLALFRHLCDLILQDPALDQGADGKALADILWQLRAEVPVEARRAAAKALLAQAEHPKILIELLATDTPAVSRPVLDRITLGENGWLDLVAKLPSDAKRHLRVRADLPAAVRRALKEKPAPVTMQTARAEAQVRAMLDRLAALSDQVGPEMAATETPRAMAHAGADELPEPPPPGRAQTLFVANEPPAGRASFYYTAPPRSDQQPPSSPHDPAADQITPAQRFGAGDDWVWETGRDGRLMALGGDPGCFLDDDAAKLLGHHLADLFAYQVGDHVRLERRMRDRRPFRDIALVATPAYGGGKWRIAGVPVFEPGTGMFQGYRGTGRAESYYDQLLTARTSPTPQPAAMGIDPVHWAHEMRTPLNAIKGFAEMIENEVWGEVPAPYRDRSERIRATAARADRVVGDLLSLARLEGGSLVVEHEALDVAAIVDELVQKLRDDEKLDILVRCADPIPAARGDDRMLARIIDRMLRVAGRWTPKDKPIELRIGPDANGGTRFVVPVPDWRGGIDADALAKIGAPQAIDAILHHPRAQGGLGLDFAARLANEIGGRLVLEGGSTHHSQIVLHLAAIG